MLNDHQLNEHKVYTYSVTENGAGNTLRNFLVFDCGLSRKKVTEAGHTGNITVNDQQQYLNYIVKAMDIIKVYYHQKDGSQIIPEKITLNIVYEDDDILVIDKPPNLVVHPTLGYLTGTLANGITYYWQEKGLQQPVRIINRLDRDTSGLVLIASNEIASHHLNQSFEQGIGSKKYLALVENKIEPPIGTINKPIGRCYGSIILRTITNQGKPAITHYKVIKYFKKASLVEIQLETGRTHQIRVHFASIGHPLIGDSLYGKEYQPILNRHGLHCCYIKFKHPRTGKIFEFTSSLPEDFQNALEKLE